MSISQFDLELFAHGMELFTLHYKTVQQKQSEMLEFLNPGRYTTYDEFEKVNDTKRKNYSLRSRVQKRRRIVEEIIKIEETEAEEVEFISDIYHQLRSKFRFGIRREYIERFVDKHVNSFQDLLQFGRFVLQHIYKNKDRYIDTPTGIEESIYIQGDWPILQMIELNNYIYTHASTNYPCELFQPMFLYAYIAKNDLPIARSTLESFGYEVVVKDCHNEPWGIEKKEWLKDFVSIEITDPVLTNRNLYQRVLTVFKKLQ